MRVWKFLSNLVLKTDKVISEGDFNIYVEIENENWGWFYILFHS